MVVTEIPLISSPHMRKARTHTSARDLDPLVVRGRQAKTRALALTTSIACLPSSHQLHNRKTLQTHRIQILLPARETSQAHVIHMPRRKLPIRITAKLMKLLLLGTLVMETSILQLLSCRQMISSARHYLVRTTVTTIARQALGKKTVVAPPIRDSMAVFKLTTRRESATLATGQRLDA